MRVPNVFMKENENRVIDVNSLLFENRIVKIWGNIDEVLAEEVISQLKVLEFLDEKEPIQMLIHSNGGEVYSGLAIIDIMKKVSCPIETICVGKAYSMGAMILSQGDVRKASENAQMMLHQPSGGMSGKEMDIRVQADQILKMKHRLYKLLEDKTNKNMNEIEKDLDRDLYLNSEEAIAYGLIDEIL